MRVDLIKIRRMLRYVTREKERKQNKREGARNHYHDFSYRYFVFFFFFHSTNVDEKGRTKSHSIRFFCYSNSVLIRLAEVPPPRLSFWILECVEKEEVKFLDGLFI